MKSTLIMCNTNSSGDPRPNRMINYLKDIMNVSVLAKGGPNIGGIQFISLPKKNLPEKIFFALNLLLGRFETALWTKRMKKLQATTLKNNYDLIIVHDIILLPLALGIKKNAKILMDAREYYPRQKEDSFIWRIFLQGFNKYLVSHYLPKCDKVITVSEGIALEYFKQYGVKCDVMMSLPGYKNCLPLPTKPDNIKIIHHGVASPSRKTELMIEIMDCVDERFTLDLMLLPSKSKYFRKLQAEVNKRRNVKIIPPVPYNEIISFTNQYDIGLYLFPPTSFNGKHALPNKFFEFIQARLMVAIGPSVEMRKVVEKWDCGIVAKDFEPQTAAKELNKLTGERIMYYKNQSNKASEELNAEFNYKKVRKITSELIGKFEEK